MEIKTLTDQVSVSEQINDNDIQMLLDLSIDVLVCNRPDGESNEQPSFNQIKKVAEKAGLQVEFIPFSGGNFSEDDVQRFVKLLETDKKIHAYCRSGNRSTLITNAAYTILHGR